MYCYAKAYVAHRIEDHGMGCYGDPTEAGYNGNGYTVSVVSKVKYSVSLEPVNCVFPFSSSQS